MFMSFYVLKTWMGNPSLFFSPSRIAHVYLCVGRWVLSSLYLPLPNDYRRPIFLVLPKLDGWQIGLPKYRRCSRSRLREDKEDTWCVRVTSKTPPHFGRLPGRTRNTSTWRLEAAEDKEEAAGEEEPESPAPPFFSSSCDYRCRIRCPNPAPSRSSRTG
jgi:hypothetical protein